MRYRVEQGRLQLFCLFQQMGSLGFFSVNVPEEDGGLGLGALGSAVLAEELGRSTFGGFAITAIAHVDLAMRYLLRSGTSAQKERWLPGLMAGTSIGALAVTEPDAGSDVAGMRTTARRDGDGFVLDGSKMFITNGVHADLAFVAARTNTTAKASRNVRSPDWQPGYRTIRPCAGSPVGRQSC